MIRTLLSISICDVALQTAIHAYSPKDQAVPWSEMSKLLLEAIPSREDLILCMKCEMAFGDAFYEGVLNGDQPIENLAELGEALPFWKRLPGQIVRERRVYRRDFAEFILALERGQDTSVLSTDLAKRFHGYLSRHRVQYHFQKTTALVFEALGRRNERGFQLSQLLNSYGLSSCVEIVGGDVEFYIKDVEVDLKIVSSHWVERTDRKVVFRMRKA